MDESVLAFLRESQVPFTNSQAEQNVRMIDKGATEGLGQGPGQAGAQDFVPLRRVLSSAWKPAATTRDPAGSGRRPVRQPARVTVVRLPSPRLASAGGRPKLSSTDLKPVAGPTWAVTAGTASRSVQCSNRQAVP